MSISRVDIRPGVSVLSVLRHLNYRPWYALAEFVDNSLQSFLSERQELQALGGNAKLHVRIDLDNTMPTRLTIRDDAAGIPQGAYTRAFRAAAVPPDRSGLSEFGMGMKSAASWFAPRWDVRTCALGEGIERTISFDIDEIVHDQIEELTVLERRVPRDYHYTEVVLHELFHPPVGRTIFKLKEHLTDIYRVFVRNDLLELDFNDEALVYAEPRILVAPYFKQPDGEAFRWRKEIAFDFGDGLSVNGFAAIRETGNTSRAGFALFRRGRLIQGSGDDGYRPEYIFGKSNSYRYQRVLGELHLDGFDVSHTKDGFQWDEQEQAFLELLREYLDSDDMPLLRQAEGYRVRASRAAIATLAEQAVSRTAAAIEATIETSFPRLADLPPVPSTDTSLVERGILAARSFSFRFRSRPFTIKLDLTDDPAQGEWLQTSIVAVGQADERVLELRLSMAHPFMVRFGQGAADDLEGLLRVAAAIGLAEFLAREAGVQLSGTVRRNVNDILRESLSMP
jgi:hypothetical protein